MPNFLSLRFLFLFGALNGAGIIATGQPAAHETQMKYPPGRWTSRSVPQVVVDSFRRNPAFAYANDSSWWAREKPSPPPDIGWLRSPVTRWLFVGGVGGLLLYGLFLLLKENFAGIWARKNARIPASALPSEPGSMNPEDLDHAYDQALRTGDLRLAVRLRYLQLIGRLQEKQFLPAGTPATNQAWSTVFSDAEQARRFRSLASAYEHVVYGGFVPTLSQFEQLRRQFGVFEEKLPA